jgi:hypothetical protein
MNYVQGSDEYGAVIGKLKAALDPNGILAPGRYDSREHATPIAEAPALRAVVAR